MSPIEPDGVVAPRIPIDLASILHLNRYIAVTDCVCTMVPCVINLFMLPVGLNQVDLPRAAHAAREIGERG
jgi:hypothetical protein